MKFNILEDLRITQEKEFESIFNSLTKLNDKEVICGTMYRSPHNKLSFQQFIEQLTKSLSSLKKTKTSFYLLENFNLDFLAAICGNNGTYTELMFEHNFHPFINKPTRATLLSSTAVDHIGLMSLASR